MLQDNSLNKYQANCGTFVVWNVIQNIMEQNLLVLIRRQ